MNEAYEDIPSSSSTTTTDEANAGKRWDDSEAMDSTVDASGGEKRSKSRPLVASDYVGFAILAISMFIMGGCFMSTLWSTISLIVASQAKKGGLQPVDIAFSVIYYVCVVVMFTVGVTGCASSLAKNRKQKWMWSVCAVLALVMYAALQAASTISSLVFSIKGLATHTSKNKGYDIFIVIYYSGSLVFTQSVALLCMVLHVVRWILWIREPASVLVE